MVSRLLLTEAGAFLLVLGLRTPGAEWLLGRGFLHCCGVHFGTLFFTGVYSYGYGLGDTAPALLFCGSV